MEPAAANVGRRAGRAALKFSRKIAAAGLRESRCPRRRCSPNGRMRPCAESNTPMREIDCSKNLRKSASTCHRLKNPVEHKSGCTAVQAGASPPVGAGSGKTSLSTILLEIVHLHLFSRGSPPAASDRRQRAGCAQRVAATRSRRETVRIRSDKFVYFVAFWE